MQAALFTGDEHVARMNGQDRDGYDKSVMVNAADVERSMLEVALQAVRDNPDVRRPDGRKSPYMLCAQEAMRLRTEARAREQELETLRAQLKLWNEGHESVRLQNEASQLGAELDNAKERAKQMRQQLTELFRERGNLLRILAYKNDLNFERYQSRWFRLGRRLGFYR